MDPDKGILMRALKDNVKDGVYRTDRGNVKNMNTCNDLNSQLAYRLTGELPGKEIERQFTLYHDWNREFNFKDVHKAMDTVHIVHPVVNPDGTRGTREGKSYPIFADDKAKEAAENAARLDEPEEKGPAGLRDPTPMETQDTSPPGSRAGSIGSAGSAAMEMSDSSSCSKKAKRAGSCASRREGSKNDSPEKVIRYNELAGTSFASRISPDRLEVGATDDLQQQTLTKEQKAIAEAESKVSFVRASGSLSQYRTVAKEALVTLGAAATVVGYSSSSTLLSTIGSEEPSEVLI